MRSRRLLGACTARPPGMADGSQAGHPVVRRTSGQTILVASPYILTGHILTVGLGPVASGGSLGPVQLHHPLGLSVEEPGQAGAVAAGAFDRPHPPAALMISPRQELPVASWNG